MRSFGRIIIAALLMIGASCTRADKFYGEDIFLIDVTLQDGVDAHVAVSSTADARFFFDIVSQVELQRTGMDVETFALRMVSDVMNLYLSLGFSPKAALDLFSSSVSDSYDYECLPNTDYFAFAVSLSEEGRICSAVAVREFFTGDVPMSQNDITISVSGITARNADISISTTETDTYFFSIEPTASIPGQGIDRWLIEKYHDTIKSRIFSGPRIEKRRDLMPGVEYTAVAFGYKSFEPTTRVFSVKFTTDSVGDAGKCTFEFSSNETTQTEIGFSVTPSDDSVYYLWDICQASMGLPEIKAQIESEVAHYIEVGDVKSRAEYMNIIASRGGQKHLFGGLKEETAYCLYAIPVDIVTGEFASAGFLSEPVSTLPVPVSDIEVTLESDGYFDGDEMAKSDPQRYEDCIGMAYAPFSLKLSREPVHTYVLAFYYSEGYEDRHVLTDTAIIKSMLSSEKTHTDERSIVYLLRWDTDIIIFATAVDEMGLYSRVYRYRIRASRENARHWDASLQRLSSVFSMRPSQVL